MIEVMRHILREDITIFWQYRSKRCHVLCHARGWGHVTAVRFWGSTAPAISIKHVSVGGPHSAPETVIVGWKMYLSSQFVCGC